MESAEVQGTEPSKASEPALPLAGRAKVVIWILVAVVLSDIAAAVADSLHISVLSDLDAGRNVSGDDLQASDYRVALTGGIQLVAYVAAIISFLAWFYRAYSNLPRLGLTNPRYKRGWSIGAWFIPILNLFRPKQIANDIYRASDPSLEPVIGKGFSEKPVAGLLHWWWAIWLISGWLSTRAFSTDFQAGTISEQQTSTSLYLASDILDAVAAILAIYVVRLLTRRQEERRAKLAAASELTGA